MKGIELKVKRTAARVSVTALAEEMGVSVSRVSHIEQRDTVTDQATVRYLEALRRLTAPTAAAS